MSTLILKVDRPAYGGLYIGRYEGKVVMISGAVIPGEMIEADVTKERKDYIEASLKNVLEASPSRIKPSCKYYGICGGCQLQHIPYELQIRLKEDILRDCLRRMGKTDIELSMPIVCDNPWNYRLRAQFKICHGEIGFYKENTRELVDIDACPLLIEDINVFLEKIRSGIKDIGSGEVHITCGQSSSTVLIKAASNIQSSSHADMLALRFLDLGFSGGYIQTQDNTFFRFGVPHIILNLDSLKFTVSPMSFVQSHWRLNQVVAEVIKNDLEPLKDKKILDMYSGAGNFSILLAENSSIVAVEENPYAIEDGKVSLQINGIKNYRFINLPSEDFKTDMNFDVVIIDPPRSGISNKVMYTLLSLLAERIVYISCNPATLARDIRKLLKRYTLESVRMIDFFPQTSHLESIALLRIK